MHCAHRGATWYRFAATGHAAHGSTPHLGENAVERLATALLTWKPAQSLTSDATLGMETLNIGTFRGGSAPNIVPDHAEATIDFRTVSTSPAHQRIKGLPDDIAVSVDLDLAPLRTDSQNPFVQNLPSQVSEDPVAYFTDGSEITAARPDLPIVIWGPGEPGQMHSVNEQIPVSSLIEAEELFFAHLTGPRPY